MIEQILDFDPIPTSYPTTAQVHIYCLEFAPYLNIASQLLSCLSAAERGRESKLRFAPDRDRFILSHAYLRTVLAGYLGTDPASVKLEQDSRGKPLLSGATAQIMGFNLAHCSTHVAVAVAATEMIGIDIEQRRPEVEALNIAKRFFAPAEADRLTGLPPEHISSHFFRLWTCKEAFVKAIGLGLSYSFDRFVASADPNPEYVSLEPEYGPASSWSLITFKPAADCYAAVAVKIAGAVPVHFHRP